METYDASIGGNKGLLYVGYGVDPGTAAAAAGEKSGNGGDSVTGGTGIRFVRGRDGGVPMEFDASRQLLSCRPKGRYRMIVSYADGDGERRLVIVRVLGTAIDRVIGAVLELAELAEEQENRGGAGGAARGQARTISTAEATAAAAFDGDSSDLADAPLHGGAAADAGGHAPLVAEAGGDAPMPQPPPAASAAAAAVE